MPFEVKPNKRIKIILLPYIISIICFEFISLYFIGLSIYAIVHGHELVAKDAAYFLLVIFFIMEIPLIQILYTTIGQCYNEYIFYKDYFTVRIGKNIKEYRYSEITGCIFERYGKVDKLNVSTAFTLKIKKKMYYIYMDYHSNFKQIYAWLVANHIEITGDEISEYEFETLDYEDATKREDVFYVDDNRDENIEMTASVKTTRNWMVKNYFKPVFALWVVIYIPIVLPFESMNDLWEKMLIVLVASSLSQLLVAGIGWLCRKEYYIVEDGIVIKKLLKTKKYTFEQLSDVTFHTFTASRAAKMTSELSFYVGSKKYWLYGHDYDNLEGFVKMLNTKTKVVTR